MSEDTTTNHKAQVIVYSTSWCAFCHTEMEWLQKLGVDFVVKDIEAEPAARDELLSKNGGNFQGVPVTDVCGELVLGFDRPKLQDLLRKNGLISE
ncbi:MAG: glutaredoxin domain-containing protein [Candidatus Saccharibacteria bacterium]|nr:glutaredoxin domain-containing protein [Candidatus Saccharibacteria bacterium]